jgi:hypothetical protein
MRSLGEEKGSGRSGREHATACWTIPEPKPQSPDPRRGHLSCPSPGHPGFRPWGKGFLTPKLNAVSRRLAIVPVTITRDPVRTAIMVKIKPMTPAQDCNVSSGCGSIC